MHPAEETLLFLFVALTQKSMICFTLSLVKFVGRISLEDNAALLYVNLIASMVRNDTVLVVVEMKQLSIHRILTQLSSHSRIPVHLHRATY